MKIVLDASAFLRYTDDEAGAEHVENLMKSARRGMATLLISAANWSEVCHVFHKRLGKQASRPVLDDFKQLPLDIVAVDEPCSREASLLRFEQGIPFADSFAAALTALSEATLITADFDFKQAAEAGAIQVEFLPTKK